MISYKNAIHKDFGSYAIQNDIIIMPFWTEQFCSELVEVCEQHTNRFIIDKNRYYFTEEMPLSKISLLLLENFAEHCKKSLISIMKKEWEFIEDEIYGIDSPYIIRYRKEACTKIDIHCDNSVVSLNVKLNSNYNGCDLNFPRQNFTAKDVPVGHVMLWPGKVTHPHKTDKLVDGVKYSFVAFFTGLGYNNVNPYVPNIGYKF